MRYGLDGFHDNGWMCDDSTMTISLYNTFIGVVDIGNGIRAVQLNVISIRSGSSKTKHITKYTLEKSHMIYLFVL